MVIRPKLLTTICQKSMLGGFNFSRPLSIDKKELQNFAKLGNVWMDENSEFKALHSLNRLRVPSIIDALKKRQNTTVYHPLSGTNILDVGCGGGILSLALHRLGSQVTGLDACQESIIAANAHTSSLPANVKHKPTFVHSTIEAFAKTKVASFDAVIASEVLEHVPDIDSFVKGCVDATKPGGILFFSTINKTYLSRLLTITFAEDIAGIVPQGVHDWDKFVDPNNLMAVLSRNNAQLTTLKGISYNPFTNKWFWTDNVDVNYFAIATKR